MPVKQNPLRRRRMAERKMAESDFKRNIQPLILAEREAFQQAVRESADSRDPWKKKAADEMAARDAIQRERFEAAQPRSIDTTAEDRILQQQDVGIERDLDTVILKATEQKKRKK